MSKFKPFGRYDDSRLQNLNQMNRDLFNQEYNISTNNQYLKLALEVLERYESQADQVRSPVKLLASLVLETYKEARDLGFEEDINQWRKCILNQRVNLEND